MAWYNTSWRHRVKITVLNGQVNADLTGFPVYLKLSLLPTHFHQLVNQTDARDIRITTSDGVTEVPREIVYYDSSADEGEVHFKANVLDASDVDFYVYYGNAAATDYATNATFGAQNVWDSNYVMVQHGGSPATIALADSTVSANNISNTALVAAAGQLGGALSGNGSTSVGTVADQATQKNLTALTLELWTRIAAFTPNTDGVIWFSKNVNDATATDPYQTFVFFTDASGVVYFRITNGVTVGSYAAQTLQTGAGYLTTATWLYLAATYDASTLRIYKNGTVFGTTVAASGVNTGSAVTNAMRLGDFGPTGFNYHLNGLMDEMRMSKIARAATWLSTQYNNQNSAATFFTIGAAEFAPHDLKWRTRPTRPAQFTPMGNKLRK